MKDFHSFIYQATDAGKKGRKNKTRLKKTDSCNYLPTHASSHFCNCPLARSSCPLHGNPHHHCLKNEKPEKEENVILSFHATSKTDKLFEPVKSLLAHCNPDTKINLEYYFPNSSESKDRTRHRHVQTNSEKLKSPGCSFFLDKSKSFVQDRATSLKKLKQCFHSPCNSIVTRVKSQTTVEGKASENESAAKCTADGTGTPEETLGELFCDRLRWASFNKLDSSDCDKSSEDKFQSDFLTLTRKKENDIIDHKIFQIKHKKSFGDFRLAKFSKQTQLVYPSRISRKSDANKTEYAIQPHPSRETKSVERYGNSNKVMTRKVHSKEELSGSGSSSGSVYFTPYILVPPRTDKDNSESSKSVPREQVIGRDAGVQVGDNRRDTIDQSAQTEIESLRTVSTLAVPSTHDQSLGSGNISTFTANASVNTRNASMQADDSSRKESKSPRKTTIPAKEPSLAIETIDEKEEKSSGEFSQPYEEESRKSSAAALPQTYDKFRSGTTSQSYDEKSSTTTVSQSSQKKDSVQKKEPMLVYEEVKNLRDGTVQTDQISVRDVQVETMKAKKNKMLMTYPYSAKSVQTSLSYSGSRCQSNEDEYVDLESNVTFVVSSTIRSTSSQAVDQLWVKSHSDGELYNRKPLEASSNHHICLCNSDISDEERQSEKEDGTVDVTKRRRAMPDNYMQSKGEQTNLSDLSELAKMIDSFFNKVSKEVCKSCSCEKKEQNLSEAMKKSKDAEVQTSLKIIVDDFSEDVINESPSKVRVRRSIPKSDDCQTIFLCKMCSRAMSIVVVEKGIGTDDVELLPYKKKTIDTFYDDLTDSISGRKTLSLSVRTSEPPSLIDETEWKKNEMVEAPRKTSTKRPVEDSKTLATKPSSRKPSMERSDKPVLEDRLVPSRDSSLSKAKPQPSKARTAMPPPKHVTRRSINFKDREPILESPPLSPQKPAKPNNQCNLQIQNCICEIPGTSDTKPPKPPTPKGSIRKNSKISDQQSAVSDLPNWLCNTKTNSFASNRVSSGSRKSNLMYPAIVKPMWYTDFRKTWKVVKGQYESNSFGQKQKRTCEVEDDSPAGKKVKGRNDGSGETFASGGDTRRGKNPNDANARTEFIWIPSLVFQLAKPETRATNLLKGTKSDSKLRKGPNLFSGFGKDAASKTCRLKPVQVNEKHPFRKLFEFRLCKSLTFLKNDQKNYHQNEQSNEPEYELPEYRDESSINDCPPENWESTSQTDHEYVVECSFNSDNSDSAGSAENDYVEEEEEQEQEKEIEEMNYYHSG